MLRRRTPRTRWSFVPLEPTCLRLGAGWRSTCADGTFAESGLGATDVPEEATGTWTLEGDTITLSKGATQGVPREMQVVTADEERLILKRGDAG